MSRAVGLCRFRILHHRKSVQEYRDFFSVNTDLQVEPLIGFYNRFGKIADCQQTSGLCPPYWTFVVVID